MRATVTYLLLTAVLADTASPSNATDHAADHATKTKAQAPTTTAAPVATTRILDLDPHMTEFLAADTVSNFNPKCFEKHCDDVLQKTFKEYPQYKERWHCVTSTAHPKCVANERWGDFPAYEMNVMDCGHAVGCMQIDLSGATEGNSAADGSEEDRLESADGSDMDDEIDNRHLHDLRESLAQEHEDDEEEGEEHMEDDEIVEAFKKKLSDQNYLSTLSTEEVETLHSSLKEQMQKIAVLEAVLSTFEEMGHKKPPVASMIQEDGESGDDGFLDWYKSVASKLHEMQDASDISPQSLLEKISEATKMVASVMDENPEAADETLTHEVEKDVDSTLEAEIPKEHSTVGEVRKPTMEAVSVSADGQLTNEARPEKNLRNEK